MQWWSLLALADLYVINRPHTAASGTFVTCHPVDAQARHPAAACVLFHTATTSIAAIAAFPTGNALMSAFQLVAAVEDICRNAGFNCHQCPARDDK